jgi:hypothetical protein
MNPQTPEFSPKKQSKLPLVIACLLLVIALVFGIWAFGQMQDYKNNSDKKVATAVAASQKAQSADLQAKFDEQSKSPYKTYQGSATYGSLNFSYPKSYNGYDASDDSQPLNLYFFNGIIPAVGADASYPLRVELLSTDYAQAVQQFSTQLTDATVKASAYIPPKMKGVANIQPGTRFDGAIGQTTTGTKQGSMVVLRLRDKTLRISAETAGGVKDLDNIILPSLTYVP